MAKVRTAAKRRTAVRRLHDRAILPGGAAFLLGMPTGSEPVAKARTAAGGVDMKNKAIKIGIIASLLPHLFCCVLPIVLSVIGLVAPEFAHSEYIPHWIEPWLFVFSGLMLGLSWYLVLRDCHCDCDQCHGAHSHRTSRIILAVITLIFIVSIVLHLAAH